MADNQKVKNAINRLHGMGGLCADEELRIKVAIEKLENDRIDEAPFPICARFLEREGEHMVVVNFVSEAFSGGSLIINYNERPLEWPMGEIHPLGRQDSLIRYVILKERALCQLAGTTVLPDFDNSTVMVRIGTLVSQSIPIKKEHKVQTR